MHVHVESGDGEAKFWIEPVIALASYKGLSKKELTKIQTEIERRRHDIETSWKKHFKG